MAHTPELEKLERRYDDDPAKWFAQLAEAYGIPSAVAESNEQFQQMFEEFAQTRGPALIELRTDPDVVNPNATITDLRRRTAKSS